MFYYKCLKMIEAHNMYPNLNEQQFRLNKIIILLLRLKKENK